MSDSSNSFYGSNSKWLDERRDGSLGLPDVDEGPDLLETYKKDAAALTDAADTWWSVATWAIDLVRGCYILDIPRGFTRLTDVLILFCDTVQTNIDASPLRELHDVLYAREGELYDLVSKVCWQRTLEETESILHKAMIVKDRIKAVAAARSKELPHDVPPDSQDNDGPFHQRIRMVREVLKKHPNETQKKIQAILRKHHGGGMGNPTLMKVLDFLRQTGEYSRPARKRSKNGK